MRLELKDSIITTWYYRRPTFSRNKTMHTSTMPGTLEEQLRSFSCSFYRLKGKNNWSKLLPDFKRSSVKLKCMQMLDLQLWGIHYIISLLSFFQQQIKDKVFSLYRRHKQCRLCQDESLNEDDPSDTLISMTILTASILLSKNRAKIMVCPSLNRFCEQKHLLTLQTWAIAMKPGVS